jgi:hypothetical protein
MLTSKHLRIYRCFADPYQDETFLQVLSLRNEMFRTRTRTNTKLPGVENKTEMSGSDRCFSFVVVKLSEYDGSSDARAFKIDLCIDNKLKVSHLLLIVYKLPLIIVV